MLAKGVITTSQSDQGQAADLTNQIWSPGWLNLSSFWADTQFHQHNDKQMNLLCEVNGYTAKVKIILNKEDVVKCDTVWW